MDSPLEQGSNWFISAGIKSNHRHQFTVEQTGKFWYGLLHDLEQQAEQSHNFAEIQKCVLRDVEIRSQLKKQGF